MTVPDLKFVSLMGWTTEQWSAARQWAMRHNVPLPATFWPKFEDLGYGILMPQESLAPWADLKLAWHNAHGDRHPSLGKELLGLDP